VSLPFAMRSERSRYLTDRIVMSHRLQRQLYRDLGFSRSVASMPHAARSETTRKPCIRAPVRRVDDSGLQANAAELYGLGGANVGTNGSRGVFFFAITSDSRRLSSPRPTMNRSWSSSKSRETWETTPRRMRHGVGRHAPPADDGASNSGRGGPLLPTCLLAHQLYDGDDYHRSLVTLHGQGVAIALAGINQIPPSPTLSHDRSGGTTSP